MRRVAILYNGAEGLQEYWRSGVKLPDTENTYDKEKHDETKINYQYFASTLLYTRFITARTRF